MRAALSSSRLHFDHPLKGRSIEVRAGNRNVLPRRDGEPICAMTICDAKGPTGKVCSKWFLSALPAG